MPDPLNDGTLDGIRDLQRYCYENAKESGFHEAGDNVNVLVESLRQAGGQSSDALAESVESAYAGNRLMLISGEVTEAHEELRSGHKMNELYHNTSPGKEGKPEGVPSELADALIRILDTAQEYKIDLAAVILEKLLFNASRGVMHGGRKF